MAAPAPLLAGQTLPAEVAQHFGTTITSYTPTLGALTTNPTLGSPGQVQQGFWSQQGDLVHVKIFIQFGSAGTAAGSGAYFVTLPSAAPLLDYGMSRVLCGSGVIEDAGGGTEFIVQCVWRTGDPTNQILVGPAEGVGYTTHNSPFAWAASDNLNLSLTYPGSF